MLTKQQIGQMIRAKNHESLVQRILANGRCGDAAVIELLTQQAAETAGLGLALQRWCELDGGGCGIAIARPSAAGNRGRGRGRGAGPEDLIPRIVGRLSEIAAGMTRVAELGEPVSRGLPGGAEETPGGSLFDQRGALTSAEVAALACACRGLLDHARHPDRSALTRLAPPAADTIRPATRAACEQARQAAEEIIDCLAALQQPDGSIGSTLASAIILWQLGGEPKFQAAISLDDLCLAVRRTRVRTAQAPKVGRRSLRSDGRQRPPRNATRGSRSSGARNGRMRGRDQRAIPIDEGLRRQALAWSA